MSLEDGMFYVSSISRARLFHCTQASRFAMRNLYALVCTLLVASISTLGSINVYGSTIVSPGLERMTEASELIAEVQVVGIQKMLLGKRPVQLIRVRVLEALKGSSTHEEFLIYKVGGVVNHQELHIDGIHDYRRDEKLLFFGVVVPETIRAGLEVKELRMFAQVGIGLGKFEQVIEEGTVEYHEARSGALSLKTQAFNPPLKLDRRELLRRIVKSVSSRTRSNTNKVAE